MYQLLFPIHLTLMLLASIKETTSQTGGTLPSGDTYVCVPPGYCNNNAVPPSGGIDPRIITPSQQCPTGTIVCVTQGATSKCGERFVPYTNGLDGTVTVPQAYPWQAWIQNQTTFAGNGVLLDNFHVLTAAHKVASYVNAPNTLTVLMGVYNPLTDRATAQNRPVAKIKIHPTFNSTYLKNDIAILRLATPISLSQNNVNTACLPPTGSNSTTYIGSRCVVAGWGQTTFENPASAPTNPMKQVFVNITTYAACRTAFLNGPLPNVDAYLDQAGEICAGGVAQRDACTQDGGAPLICYNAMTSRGYIAGLVIWGKNCGQPGIYGVYVSVPAYKQWIDATITCLNNATC